MKESDLQSRLISIIQTRFPGSIVLKNDEQYKPGFPDLTVLYKDKWVVLECKKSKGSAKQPNQEYYIKTLNEMSYAAFVYPENMEDVLDALQRSFTT